ncbi:sulfite exporter TauE/SafE family protein [Rhizobium sp. YIM 134829]|uniref:sulfite exporter TauE/SafE family protein n=1 Tax=Rhizobium sp. YIM 134829 TaxID=3390453 RepID=UPI003978B5F8
MHDPSTCLGGHLDQACAGMQRGDLFADDAGERKEHVEVEGRVMISISVSYLALSIGAVIAGLVQGMSGFGFGLVAMSVWVWFVEPRVAACLVVFGALVGQVAALYLHKPLINVKLLWPHLVGALVGIPIGATLLPLVDPIWFRTGFGVFLVAWSALMFGDRFIPKMPKNDLLAPDIAVGFIGGTMGGIGGFSGVIPTLWWALRGLNKREHRSLMQVFNLCTLTVTMAYYVYIGLTAGVGGIYFIIVAAAVLLPVIIGVRVFMIMPDAAFRRTVILLLGFSGVAMVVSGLRD